MRGLSVCVCMWVGEGKLPKIFLGSPKGDGEHCWGQKGEFPSTNFGCLPAFEPIPNSAKRCYVLVDQLTV